MQIEAFLADRAVSSRGRRSVPAHSASPVVVRREPVGVVAAIAPWNVPQFTIMSKLVPALLAGCSVVREAGAGDAARRATCWPSCCEEAGVPAGVVNIVAGRTRGRASTSSRTPASTRWRSPARPRPAVGSPRSAASSSSGSASSSAASRRRSSSTTPTSPPPCEGLKFTALMNSGQACVAQTRILRLARQLRRGRRRARCGASARCRWATPPTRPPRSARWSPQRQQERVEKYIALGQEEGARVVARRQRHARRPRPRLVRASPPCSPTSTTACGSPRRRSSARSSR